MGLKVSAVRDFSIELVNELGHWLIFAVDELSIARSWMYCAITAAAPRVAPSANFATPIEDIDAC